MDRHDLEISQPIICNARTELYALLLIHENSVTTSSIINVYKLSHVPDLPRQFTVTRTTTITLLDISCTIHRFLNHYGRLIPKNGCFLETGTVLCWNTSVLIVRHRFGGQMICVARAVNNPPETWSAFSLFTKLMNKRRGFWFVYRKKGIKVKFEENKCFKIKVISKLINGFKTHRAI